MKYEFDSAPAPAQSRSVCDGIQWFYMPLPFALDHVNCWLLGEPDEQLLIDTGVDNESTRDYWHSIFSRIGQWPRQLLATHFHPDHIGLAGWFESQNCSRFIGSKIEVEISHALWGSDKDDYARFYERWYTENGLPEEVVQQVRKNGNTYCGKVHRPPEMARWSFLDEAQTITIAQRQYRVIIGRGHAPDMIMLYREDDHILIAADQVLPSISPNVSVMPRLQDKNPLSSFLGTLDALKKLPDDTLVLPSHGLPFRGLHERLQVLREHHDLRLQQVHDACSEPHSAHELFPILFRRQLDAQQTSFALGESLAHLHFLEHQGRITRFDENGVTRFLAA
ncbi:MAG: MBL fold metallo-hydrolase [Granulosicoccus sp.]